jgi:hypothetical protein
MDRRQNPRARTSAARALAALLLCGGVSLLLAAAAPSAGARAAFSGPKNYATERGPVSIAIGDVNRDGNLDLATANYGKGTNSVSVLINRGDGSFRVRRDYRTGESPGFVAVGDLNGDGATDVATANDVADTVSVLLNRGDGRLAPRADYRTGTSPAAVAIADANDDGKPDLVTANFDANTVSVLVNRGDGSFDPNRAYPTRREPQAIAIGDLNGDGKPDVATAHRSDRVAVLLNRGDGSFRPRVEFKAGSGPRAVAIGDVNGDRRLDLVTANSNSAPATSSVVSVDTVSVLINTGSGSFRAKRDYRAGVGSWWVAIGDLNGDGKQDLATANVLGSVSVLENRGNGRFQARRDYRTRVRGDEPYGPTAVVVGHLNADRRLDLATANSDAPSVSVLINRTGRCTVPSVTGKALAAAKRAIALASCGLGGVSHAYSRLVGEGRVISQRPKAGTPLPRGGKVSIVVSRGRRQ